MDLYRLWACANLTMDQGELGGGEEENITPETV